MKKLLSSLAAAGLLVVAAVCPAFAITWLGVNQATVAWDPVTTLADGNPIPAGDTVSYRVYTKMMPSNPEVLQGESTTNQFTLTFSAEGRYVVGIQTVRIPAGETEEQVSTITWSDSEDTNLVPDPFGIKYFVSPSAPKGLLAE